MPMNSLIVPVLTSLAIAVTGALTPTPYTPLVQFGNSEPGLVLDANDLTTIFQDAAGTTPLTGTGAEQNIGLMLDKSQGLIKTQQITNIADRTFASNTGFWTLDAGSVTISGGTANWAATPNRYAFSKGAFLAAGKAYLVTVTIPAISAGGLKFYSPAAIAQSPTYTTPGTYTAILIASSLSSFGVISVGTTTAQVSFISCELLAGNHAYQTTSANRPLLTYQYNQLTHSQNMAAWGANGATGAASGLVTTSAGAGGHYISSDTGSSWVLAGVSVTIRIVFKQGNTRYFTFGDRGDSPYHNLTVDMNTGVATGNVNGTYTVSPLQSDGTYIATLTYPRVTGATTVSVFAGANTASTTSSVPTFTAAGTETVTVVSVDVRPSYQFNSLLPAYQRIGATAADCDTVGFPPLVKGNGANQFLQGTLDLSSTNKVTMWAGFRLLSNADCNLFELSANAGSNNGSFNIGVYLNDLYLPVRGLLYSRLYAAGAAVAPQSMVLSMAYDLAAATASTQIKPRKNGAALSTTVFNETTAGGNFGSYPYYVLCRGAGTAGFMNGGFNTLVIVGKAVNDPEFSAGEVWANQKIKAYANG